MLPIGLSVNALAQTRASPIAFVTWRRPDGLTPCVTHVLYGKTVGTSITSVSNHSVFQTRAEAGARAEARCRHLSRSFPRPITGDGRGERPAGSPPEPAPGEGAPLS